MKQTAVEWLVEYLKLHGIELNNDAIHNVINQAKEMEKQQLGKFYNHGQWTTVHGDTFEDHYNKIFKSD